MEPSSNCTPNLLLELANILDLPSYNCILPGWHGMFTGSHFCPIATMTVALHHFAATHLCFDSAPLDSPSTWHKQHVC